MPARPPPRGRPTRTWSTAAARAARRRVRRPAGRPARCPARRGRPASASLAPGNAAAPAWHPSPVLLSPAFGSRPSAPLPNRGGRPGAGHVHGSAGLPPGADADRKVGATAGPMIVARSPAAAGSRKSGSASIIYKSNESKRTEGCCVSVGRVTGGVPPERMADLSVRVAWAVARITSKEGVYATNPETGFHLDRAARGD